MKIFCVGRNYTDHAKELKNEVPDEPVIFLKPKSALLQMHDLFYYPEFTNELHYEVELVLHISKNGRYISENHAGRFYDKVTAGIDFTARDLQRDLQKKGLPWEKAKAWDNSAIIGKWIALEADIQKKPLHFSMKMNDEFVQQGVTSDMIFSCNKIIANISNYFALNIGDIIFTGTPAGVGECVVGDVLTGYLESTKVFELAVK